MTLPAVLLLRLTVAGIIPFVAGCVNEGSRAADSVDPSVEARSDMPDPVPGVSVSVDAGDTVAHGDRVPIVIRVTNTTSAPVDLYLRGREVTFDIVVTDTAGSELWRRLEDETIPAILQLKTLRAGETIELRDEWNQRTRSGRPVGIGEYQVSASVVTDGTSSLLSSPARLSIIAR